MRDPIQNLRTMVHRMADEVILQLTGERGVNTTKIAYVNLQSGNKEIFVSDIDGANIRQITQNQSINISPAWTPDGRGLPSPPISNEIRISISSISTGKI